MTEAMLADMFKQYAYKGSSHGDMLNNDILDGCKVKIRSYRRPDVCNKTNSRGCKPKGYALKYFSDGNYRLGIDDNIMDINQGTMLTLLYNGGAHVTNRNAGKGGYFVTTNPNATFDDNNHLIFE